MYYPFPVPMFSLNVSVAASAIRLFKKQATLIVAT